MTIGEIIQGKKQSVELRILNLRLALAPLETELASLIATYDALGTDGRSIEVRPIRKEHIKRGPRGAIKKGILAVLSNYPNGIHCVPLTEELNCRSERQYNRTSVSPQLSRLKQTGHVIYTNGLWTLSPPTEKE